MVGTNTCSHRAPLRSCQHATWASTSAARGPCNATGMRLSRGGWSRGSSAFAPRACQRRAMVARRLPRRTPSLALVIFHLTNQSPPDLGGILDLWSRDIWDMYWSTKAGEERVANGDQRGRPPSLARHGSEVQDHADGGTRALDVHAFTAAIHTTWVRRLLDPAPRPWKNIVWSMLQSVYGTYLGQRLLVSTSSRRTPSRSRPRRARRCRCAAR